MATIKKYNGSSWENAVVRKYGTATEAVENPLYSDGTAITAYTIKGNTVQNGTPTPSNPVDVNGVGVRTENLFDSSFTVGYYLNATTGLPDYTDDPRMSTLTPIDVTAFDSVTFSFINERSYDLYVMYSIFDGNTLISRVANQSEPLTIDTSDATKLYLCVYPQNISKPISTNSISNVMLNTGSTPKPYEPYGYKIPISSGGVTTNIYLSEPILKLNSTYANVVDSVVSSGTVTRYVQKAVLTGEETTAQLGSTSAGVFVYKIEPAIPNNAGYALCSHYQTDQVSDVTMHDVRVKQTRSSYWTSNGGAILFKDSNYSSLADFKSFLMQENSNGTPVTVWYILTTAETETVTTPSILTTEGANSITVDTTVQPSEFTATWTGWHDASVKEWDGSDWQ